MSKEITLIKIGGSLITDKNSPYTARINVIRTIARHLKKIRGSLVISHGSGSFGHTSAKKYGGKKGYKKRTGITKVCLDATEINRIVMNVFVEEKIPAVSLDPRAFILTEKGEIKDYYFKVIEILLTQKLIPVVYGDVIWDMAWKSTILSGESILNRIGLYLVQQGYSVSKIIQLGITNGVYDKEGKTIPVITRSNWKEVQKFVNSSYNDVTGGMAHKIEEALVMADKGIKTLIVNGTRIVDFYNLLSGKVHNGTHIY